MQTTEGFYLEGYKLTLENAQNLQEIAEQAYRKKNYGTARSLNILSAEEGIKAMFLLLKHMFPTAQVLDFENAFANHQLNHAHIENFIAVYDLTMEKFYESIAPQWQSFIEVKKKPFTARKKVHPQFDLLYSACEHIMEYRQREISLQQLVEWLKNVAVDKPAGLHVELRDEQWKAPKEHDPQQYIQEKRLTKEVHLIAEQIELIYRQLNTWLK